MPTIQQLIRKPRAKGGKKAMRPNKQMISAVIMTARAIGKNVSGCPVNVARAVATSDETGFQVASQPANPSVLAG